MSDKKTIGIIDLGSNSSRLSIFEHYPDESYRPVFEMKRSLQLAHHLVTSGRISESGISRAVSCTQLFRRTGELYGVTQWITVATAAIRQAKNREEVLTRLAEEAKMDFRVLEGKEEGYYGYLAVVNTLDVQDALIFDIGGASSELMFVKDRRLQHVTSLPFGALNLTEMYGDLSRPEAGMKIRSFFQEQLATIPWFSQATRMPLVGLGGTARATAKLQFSRDGGKTLNSLHGYEVHCDFIKSEFDSLAAMDPGKISKIKGISKRRANIITAGVAAISAIVETISPPTLLVSRNGIREGLFFEYYLQNHEPPLFQSVLEDSIRNFLKLYDVHPTVSNTVTEASLQLFDDLEGVHQLNGHDRKLLRVTAQIESCGTYINTEKWTRHSAYLALSSNLYGLTYSELTEVADLLNGKGAVRLQKLLILIRLAKLFVLQIGVPIPHLALKIKKNSVCVKHRSLNLTEQVQASADASIQGDFQTLFGKELSFS